MRLARIDLIRYGKFTDHVIPLPKPVSGPDCHFVFGPNEAGKSTLRRALGDLLFGMPHRFDLDFLHQSSELRLGARLEHDGQTLDIVRLKARTKSLQTPQGAALADTALLPFLAGADRSFFEQMFALDHERLVTGGKDILNNSSDLGAILFQSAQGVGGLKVVRDALETEADKLWAPRKSAERQYYQASADLATAEASLREATVRTRDWLTAQDAVQKLHDQLVAARQRVIKLEEDRKQLERVRRVALPLRRLSDAERELEQLRDVRVLAPNAEKLLNDSELEQAKAEQRCDGHQQSEQESQEALEKITPDVQILNRRADIMAIAEKRATLLNHPHDIGTQELKVKVQWQEVEALVRQLGWPALAEPTLREQLQPLPLRASLASLAKRHDLVQLAEQTADQKLREKTLDLEELEQQLSAAGSAQIGPELQAALTSVRRLGHAPEQERKLQQVVDKSAHTLEKARLALGRWPLGLEQLRAIALPAELAVKQWQQQDAQLVDQRRALQTRLAELEAESNARTLQVAQYTTAHQPVTLSDVLGVRATRDVAWTTIKTAPKVTVQAAAAFEQEMLMADGLADQRHDKAEQAAELQAKKDALALSHQQREDLEAQLKSVTAELDQRASDWSSRVAQLGLAGLDVLMVDEWREAREKVLHAADLVQDAADDQAAWFALRSQTEAALRVALVAADQVPTETANVDTLELIATQLVDRGIQEATRREEMQKQQRLGATQLRTLQQQDEQAELAAATWKDEWHRQLQAAHWPDDSPVAWVEGALDVVAQIDKRLDSMEEIRRLRIKTMQRDLDQFELAATALVEAVAPDLAGHPRQTAVLELHSRLAMALEQEKEQKRLRAEVAAHHEKAEKESERLRELCAGMRPLLQQAGVTDHEALRQAIGQSERRRLAQAEADRLRTEVRDASDNLDLATLHAEVAATDITSAPRLLGEIAVELEELRGKQIDLSAQRTTAAALFDAIAGQADAARAEFDRQSALARMATAAERYIQVRTAARLLKWAIDRYRQDKQGPMLARASQLFGTLTLGSFHQLALDYDHEPPLLNGVRPDQHHVALDGMSEGTRHQLYLALRLAALELHLQQGHALPFIADDLFIHYDDARAEAGLRALGELAKHTQVIFLSHHEHLIPVVKRVFGDATLIEHV